MIFFIFYLIVLVISSLATNASIPPPSVRSMDTISEISCK